MPIAGDALAVLIALDVLAAHDALADVGWRHGPQTLQDVALGGAKVSNSYRTVADEGGAITWKNFALQSGGLKVNYDARKVDFGFSRFPDLAESERDQLM